MHHSVSIFLLSESSLQIERPPGWKISPFPIFHLHGKTMIGAAAMMKTMTKHTHTHTRARVHTPRMILIYNPRIWAVKDHKHLRQHVYWFFFFLLFIIWLVNVTFGRQIEMPIVSLYWLSFSGLAWTFQLLPKKHTQTSMRHARPITNTFLRPSCSHRMINVNRCYCIVFI